MEKVPEGTSFLKPFFFHIPYGIFVIVFFDIIGVAKFLIFFKQIMITMCNLHWCYTFCTSVTLFALVLHLNCTG